MKKAGISFKTMQYSVRKIFFLVSLVGWFLFLTIAVMQSFLGTTGYIEVAPGSSTITTEEPEFFARSIDNYSITYFFLPSYVNISRISYDRSDLKIFNPDGSLWERPEFNKVQDVLVQNADGETVPWRIGIFRSENLYTLELDSHDTLLQDVKSDEKQLFGLSVISPDGKQTFSDDILLKGRGNTTWDSHIKRPYEFKLKGEYPLCDLDSADKWVLLANAFDDTKMRNKLVFDLAADVGMEYTIASDWVDLYADGEYLGNYLLCHDPKSGIKAMDREGLQKQNSILFDDPIEIETDTMRAFDYDTSSLDMSGAYLLKIGYMHKFNGAFAAGTGRWYGIAYPNNPSIMETEYIQSVMGKAEGSIMEGEDNIPEMIDVYSFARRYLVEELAMDRDSYTESYYYYKKRSDELMYAGPCWDYDHAMSSADDERGIWQHDYNAECFPPSSMDGALISNNWYMEYVKDVFNENKKSFENLYTTQIDSYYEKIKYSLSMDRARWEDSEEQIGVYSGRYESDENNVRFLKQFIYNRLQFMSQYYGVELDLPYMDLNNDSTHILTFQYDDGNTEIVNVSDGALLSDDEIPPYDTEKYIGWVFGDGFIFSRYIPVYEDLSLRLE